MARQCRESVIDEQKPALQILHVDQRGSIVQDRLQAAGVDAIRPWASRRWTISFSSSPAGPRRAGGRVQRAHHPTDDAPDQEKHDQTDLAVDR